MAQSNKNKKIVESRKIIKLIQTPQETTIDMIQKNNEKQSTQKVVKKKFHIPKGVTFIILIVIEIPRWRIRSENMLFQLQGEGRQNNRVLEETGFHGAKGGCYTCKALLRQNRSIRTTQLSFGVG